MPSATRALPCAFGNQGAALCLRRPGRRPGPAGGNNSPRTPLTGMRA